MTLSEKQDAMRLGGNKRPHTYNVLGKGAEDFEPVAWSGETLRVEDAWRMRRRLIPVTREMRARPNLQAEYPGVLPEVQKACEELEARDRVEAIRQAWIDRYRAELITKEATRRHRRLRPWDRQSLGLILPAGDASDASTGW